MNEKLYFYPVMKTGAKIGLILLLPALLCMVSCQNKEDYPIIPQIHFSRFLLEVDTAAHVARRGVLEFTFEDGDGDIGLPANYLQPPFDPGSKYYYNLIIKYFEKQNGKFVEVPLLSWNPDSGRYDTITFNARIPWLTPDLGDKSISGTIQDTLFLDNPLSDYDTIMFTFFIYDRALHKSNVDSTPPIVRRFP
ncbi:hypothetical protein LA303_00505 [Candidatus Sulfidibacterium hydrothermale]|uniref:hypothetical protein n=1 Tax=Candidatus Sulfidibacterium hydrothermale TaxID=2875962 RepID=UPI001F0B4BFF|nr:hypothetical protein [Candidatus Sulfidibacterium hydrothermale]UBM62476.1 hypothetical protein LA303_00505 [Candidatus Sulfidibacterium hydrothermale]